MLSEQLQGYSLGDRTSFAFPRADLRDDASAFARVIENGWGYVRSPIGTIRVELKRLDGLAVLQVERREQKLAYAALVWERGVEDVAFEGLRRTYVQQGPPWPWVSELLGPAAPAPVPWLGIGFYQQFLDLGIAVYGHTEILQEILFQLSLLILDQFDCRETLSPSCGRHPDYQPCRKLAAAR